MSPSSVVNVVQRAQAAGLTTFAEVLALGELVSPAFVDAAHRHGLHVHVWTIDEPREMHRLLDLGVDGVMTDRPDLLKEVMQARGQWLRVSAGSARGCGRARRSSCS